MFVPYMMVSCSAKVLNPKPLNQDDCEVLVPDEGHEARGGSLTQRVLSTSKGSFMGILGKPY